MSVKVTNQTQSTSYGSGITLQAGTTDAEFSFLSGGALVAGTVQITDEGGTSAEIPVGADQLYQRAFARGTADRFTIKAKAAAGTPTLQIVET